METMIIGAALGYLVYTLLPILARDRSMDPATSNPAPVSVVAQTPVAPPSATWRSAVPGLLYVVGMIVFVLIFAK